MPYQNVFISPNTYQVYRFGKGDAPYMFLPGFSMHPHEYNGVFKKLDVDGASVKLIGVNYLEYQPATLEEFADIANDLSYRIFGTDEIFVGGHSTGATSLLYAASHGMGVLGMNLWCPVTVVPHDRIGLAARAIVLGFDELRRDFGFALNHGLRFIPNYLNPKYKVPTQHLTHQIADFTWWEIGADGAEKIGAPARFVFAGMDEFGFRLDGNAEEIDSLFSAKPYIATVEHYRHLWPRHYPKVAISEVEAILL